MVKDLKLTIPLNKYVKLLVKYRENEREYHTYTYRGVILLRPSGKKIENWKEFEQFEVISKNIKELKSNAIKYLKTNSKFNYVKNLLEEE